MLRSVFGVCFLIVWTFVCLLAAFLAMALTLDPSSSIWVARRMWSPPLLWAAGAKVVIDGGAEIDFSRPYIFASNHQGMLDILAVFVALPVNLRFVAKKSLSYIPLFGWYLRAAGFVLVDRRNRVKSIRSLARAGEEIRRGIDIVVFPEGTRSLDGSILPFKKGPFMLALSAQVPVVPMAVEGSHRVLPSRSLRLTPGTIHVRVGRPIETQGLGEGDRDRLMKQVRDTIIDMHLSLGGAGGDRRRPIAEAGVEGLGKVVSAALLCLLVGISGCALLGRPKPAEADPYAEAVAAMQAEQLPQAESAFRRALARDPRNLDAVRGLIQAQQRQGRLDAAVAEMKTRVDGNPSDDVGHYGLGVGLFARAADAEGAALQHLRRATELKPQQAEYHHRLGLALFEVERPAEALPELERAVSLAPAEAKYDVALGICRLRLGNRQGGLAALSKVLELNADPKDVARAKEAADRLSDPFRRLPKSVAQDFERGIAWMEEVDVPQQAIAVFEDISDRFPDIAVVHALLGLCYQRLDDAGRAVEELRKAIELEPLDPQNHLYLAELYYAKERSDRAREGFEKVLELNPFSDRAHERLGAIYAAAGDAKAAANHFRLLVLLHGEDLAAHYEYGRALLAAGDESGAERELRLVAERDPNHVEARLRLGILFADRRFKASEPSEQARLSKVAQGYFQQVLTLQPENPFAAKMVKEMKQ